MPEKFLEVYFFYFFSFTHCITLAPASGVANRISMFIPSAGHMCSPQDGRLTGYNLYVDAELANNGSIEPCGASQGQKGTRNREKGHERTAYVDAALCTPKSKWTA